MSRDKKREGGSSLDVLTRDPKNAVFELLWDALGILLVIFSLKLDSQIEIIDNRWDHRNLIVFTGGFSGGNNVNRRHLMDSATPYNRRKRRLLIALEPDYVQSQKLLSERL